MRPNNEKRTSGSDNEDTCSRYMLLVFVVMLDDNLHANSICRIEETVMVKRSAGSTAKAAMFGEYVGNKLITYNIDGLNNAK